MVARFRNEVERILGLGAFPAGHGQGKRGNHVVRGVVQALRPAPEHVHLGDYRRFELVLDESGVVFLQHGLRGGLEPDGVAKFPVGQLGGRADFGVHLAQESVHDAGALRRRSVSGPHFPGHEFGGPGRSVLRRVFVQRDHEDGRVHRGFQKANASGVAQFLRKHAQHLGFGYVARRLHGLLQQPGHEGDGAVGVRSDVQHGGVGPGVVFRRRFRTSGHAAQERPVDGLKLVEQRFGAFSRGIEQRGKRPEPFQGSLVQFLGVRRGHVGQRSGQRPAAGRAQYPVHRRGPALPQIVFPQGNPVLDIDGQVAHRDFRQAPDGQLHKFPVGHARVGHHVPKIVFRLRHAVRYGRQSGVALGESRIGHGDLVHQRRASAALADHLRQQVKVGRVGSRIRQASGPASGVVDPAAAGQHGGFHQQRKLRHVAGAERDFEHQVAHALQGSRHAVGLPGVAFLVELVPDLRQRRPKLFRSVEGQQGRGVQGPGARGRDELHERRDVAGFRRVGESGQERGDRRHFRRAGLPSELQGVPEAPVPEGQRQIRQGGEIASRPAHRLSGFVVPDFRQGGGQPVADRRIEKRRVLRRQNALADVGQHHGHRPSLVVRRLCYLRQRRHAFENVRRVRVGVGRRQLFPGVGYGLAHRVVPGFRVVHVPASGGLARLRRRLGALHGPLELPQLVHRQGDGADNFQRQLSVGLFFRLSAGHRRYRRAGYVERLGAGVGHHVQRAGVHVRATLLLRNERGRHAARPLVHSVGDRIAFSFRGRRRILLRRRRVLSGRRRILRGRRRGFRRSFRGFGAIDYLHQIHYEGLGLRIVGLDRHQIGRRIPAVALGALQDEPALLRIRRMPEHDEHVGYRHSRPLKRVGVHVQLRAVLRAVRRHGDDSAVLHLGLPRLRVPKFPAERVRRF